MGNRQNDIEKGRSALIYFHNQSARYPGYELTFDQLIASLAKKEEGRAIWMEGIGSTINELGMDDGDVKVAMEKLADRAKGKLPASNSAYFQALSDKIQDYSFIDAVKYTATETAKTVVEGTVEVGNSVIGTLKGLNVILPIAIIGGILFVIYSRSKMLAGK